MYTRKLNHQSVKQELCFYHSYKANELRTISLGPFFVADPPLAFIPVASHHTITIIHAGVENPSGMRVKSPPG